MDQVDSKPKTEGVLRRRRTMLMAGVLGVAIAGFAAGQIIPQTFLARNCSDYHRSFSDADVVRGRR